MFLLNVLNTTKEPDEQIFMKKNNIDIIENFFQEHAEDIDMMDYLNNFHLQVGRAL